MPRVGVLRGQATDADGLVRELATPALRRGYVGAMYGHRLWSAPGAFTREDVDHHTEPFARASALRAAFGVYELSAGRRALSEIPALAQENPVPTLILHGPEEVTRHFPARMAVAFPDPAGPFEVHGAGHFLQWEQPEVLHGALAAFFRDLLDRDLHESACVPGLPARRVVVRGFSGPHCQGPVRAGPSGLAHRAEEA